MLTIYVGYAGAGKTYCMKTQVKRVLMQRDGTTIYLHDPKGEWSEMESVCVKQVSHENITQICPNENDILILDSPEEHINELIILMPDLIELAKRVNVIIPLMEYDKNCEELFAKADEIRYLPMSMSSLIYIPQTYIEDRERDLLLNMNKQKIKHYMLVKRKK